MDERSIKYIYKNVICIGDLGEFSGETVTFRRNLVLPATREGKRKNVNVERERKRREEREIRTRTAWWV